MDRRERFIAETEADFAEFERLPDLGRALSDYTRDLHTAVANDETSRIQETNPRGVQERIPSLGSTGGPLTVGLAFDGDADGPGSQSQEQASPPAHHNGQVRPDATKGRYRIDSPHPLDGVYALWAKYDERWEEYLAEVRMSGDCDGDIVIPAPVPPTVPRPSGPRSRGSTRSPNDDSLHQDRPGFRP